MDKSSVRYVHLQNTEDNTLVYENLNGITIAYQRFDESIAFAVALCRDVDVYQKKVGREIAGARLEKAFANNSFFSHDNDNCAAMILSIDEVFYLLDLSSVIADSTLKDMALFDIKHSAIAKCFGLLFYAA